MSVQIPPGYILAAWEMRYPGDPDPWYCTCGFRTPDGIVDGTALANALFSKWAETIKQTQSTLMAFIGVTLKIGSDGAPSMAYSTSPAEQGGTAQNMLPQNCALLVDKLSEGGGRRSRGRFYVPACLVEGAVDNIGSINTELLATLTGAWTSFYAALGDIVESPVWPVVLHSPSTPAVLVPTPTGVPTPITSFRVQQVISTQRKRLR